MAEGSEEKKKLIQKIWRQEARARILRQKIMAVVLQFMASEPAGLPWGMLEGRLSQVREELAGHSVNFTDSD